jgi:serine/threonine protein kinase
MHREPIRMHPYVIEVLGYGWGLTEENILPFIITEFAELGCMRDYLLNCETALRFHLTLCSQVSAGLAEMHRSGIAHGDLKLENVLVSKDRGQVVAKLVSPDCD